MSTLTYEQRIAAADALDRMAAGSKLAEAIRKRAASDAPPVYGASQLLPEGAVGWEWAPCG